MSFADPIKRPPPFGNAKVFAVALGALSGSLTLAIEKLSTVSEFSVIGTVQRVVYILLFPGIFASMAIGGSVHAFQLWIAAGINSVIYFAMAWVACRLILNLYNRPL